MNFSVEYLTKPRSEILEQIRFRQNRGKPVAFRAFTYRLLDVAGHSDNRDVARLSVLLQLLKKVPNVVGPHWQLGGDDVRLHVPSTAEGFRAVFCRKHVESHRIECDGIQSEGLFVPNDDEHDGSRGRIAQATAVHVKGVKPNGIWLGV